MDEELQALLAGLNDSQIAELGQLADAAIAEGIGE